MKRMISILSCFWEKLHFINFMVGRQPIFLSKIIPGIKWHKNTWGSEENPISLITENPFISAVSIQNVITYSLIQKKAGRTIFLSNYKVTFRLALSLRLFATLALRA